jgi:putative transposase
MAKRSFTADQKVAILQQADTEGVIATCGKHQISSSLFYQWRDKLTLKGKQGLGHGQTVLTQEVRRLLAENARLKKLLAEKELVLDLKEELLKKVHQRLLSAP